MLLFQWILSEQTRRGMQNESSLPGLRLCGGVTAVLVALSTGMVLQLVGKKNYRSRNFQWLIDFSVNSPTFDLPFACSVINGSKVEVKCVKCLQCHMRRPVSKEI